MGTTRESAPQAAAGELERLRRRAYGPDADIGDDPQALARLIELEAMLGHPAAGFDAIPLETARHEATIQATSIPPVAADPAGEPISTPARRRRRIALVTLVIAVVIVTAAVASSLTAGVAAVRLYQRIDVDPVAAAQLSAVGQLGYLDIAPADVRMYDQYRGLNVWSAPRGANTTCMFVTSTMPPRWRVDCTPRGRSPMIDLLQYREDSRLAGFEALGDVPIGHVLRLVLKDGVVDVRVVKAPSATIDQ